MMEFYVNNYFPGNNTGEGFYSLYEFLPWQADSIFIIKGGPGTGKSTLMKKIANQAEQLNMPVEKHWCSSDSQSLDGVVLPDLKTAIFDGTAPHLIDPSFPGAHENIINLGQFWDKHLLRKNKQEIMELTREIAESFELAYQYLKISALLINAGNKSLENKINNRLYNKLTKELLNQVYVSSPTENAKPKDRHLFSSANTPVGRITYLSEIIQKSEKVYLLNAPLNGPVSKLLKTISNKYSQENFQQLILHDPLIPENYEAIYIEDRKVSYIYHNALPHDYSQNNKCTKYNLSSIDNNNLNTKASALRTEAQIQQQKATNALDLAHRKHDELETFYIEAMDFNGINTLTQKLIKEVFNN